MHLYAYLLLILLLYRSRYEWCVLSFIKVSMMYDAQYVGYQNLFYFLGNKLLLIRNETSLSSEQNTVECFSTSQPTAPIVIIWYENILLPRVSVTYIVLRTLSTKILILNRKKIHKVR